MSNESNGRTVSDIAKTINRRRAELRAEIQNALDMLIAYEVGHESAEVLASAVLDAYNVAQSLLSHADALKAAQRTEGGRAATEAYAVSFGMEPRKEGK